MHLQHTDPEGAVRMAMQLGAKHSVGVHWGTWLMSDEACESHRGSYTKRLTVDNKPPADLEIAKKKLDFDADRFKVMPVGETLVID